MLKPDNILHRLDTIDKYIKMYQKEKEALLQLAELYTDPTYLDLVGLEQMDSDRERQAAVVRKQHAPKASQPTKTSGKLPQGVYPLDRFLGILKEKPEFLNLFEEMTHEKVNLAATATIAKKYRTSSVTLGKIIKTAMYYKYLTLTKVGKKKYYQVSIGKKDEIRSMYSKANPKKDKEENDMGKLSVSVPDPVGDIDIPIA